MPTRLLPKISPTTGGIILLLLGELFFSSSTVFAKIATNIAPVNPHLFVFLRFALGLILVTAYLWFKKESFLPERWSLVIARGVLNTISVSFFFLALKYTSVTNANMLNMTYPAFVFLIAPLVIQEKSHAQGWLYLCLTLLGAFLVINPDFHAINRGDVYGLLSGAISGAAIVSLRMARKYESSTIILFYLMLIGTLITTGFVFPHFCIPGGVVGLYIWGAVLCGLLGQALITIGYKYIAATSGSLVSASRIVFASILGVSFCGDHLTWLIVLGGVLILWSLISLSLPQSKKTH